MNKLFVVIGTLLLLSSASGLELQNGIPKSEININDPLALELMRAGAIGMDSYLDMLENNEYVVFLNNRLFRFNYDFSIKGNWPLTRWEHEYLEQEIDITYEAGNFHRAGDSSVYLSDSAKLTHLMGCMQQSPLRYGDFTGDGAAELVVFLSDEVSTDIRVFSPDRQRVIFSSKLNFTDSLHRDDLPDYYLHDAPFQYLSWRHVNSDLPGFPATRGYAKLYVDDFDNNSQLNLVVWRKVYESNHVDGDTAGFDRLKERFLHYTLVDGEYQPVETDEATIQGWLSAQNLTWSQGFPSVSECAGEEGQLIPEMHDPLLNDPDVLQ